MRWLLNQHARKLLLKNTLYLTKQKSLNSNSLRVLSLPSLQKKFFSDSSSGNGDNKNKDVNDESKTSETSNPGTKKNGDSTKEVVFGGDFEDFDGKYSIHDIPCLLMLLY